MPVDMGQNNRNKKLKQESAELRRQLEEQKGGKSSPQQPETPHQAVPPHGIFHRSEQR